MQYYVYIAICAIYWLYMYTIYIYIIIYFYYITLYIYKHYVYIYISVCMHDFFSKSREKVHSHITGGCELLYFGGNACSRLLLKINIHITFKSSMAVF